MVATADQEHPITEAKLNGETITPEMRHAHRLHRNGNTSDPLIYVDHTYSTVWSKKVAGFTAHSFSTDFTTLKTDFIDKVSVTVNGKQRMLSEFLTYHRELAEELQPAITMRLLQLFEEATAEQSRQHPHR